MGSQRPRGKRMIDPNPFSDDFWRSLTGRRGFLAGIGASMAGIAAAAFPFPARAKDTLTVADPGGVWTPACDAAFIKPFEQEADVQINHIARQHYPSVEIKANVETKSYTWD